LPQVSQLIRTPLGLRKPKAFGSIGEPRTTGVLAVVADMDFISLLLLMARRGGLGPSAAPATGMSRGARRT
jgi:hypothetical protein